MNSSKLVASFLMLCVGFAALAGCSTSSEVKSIKKASGAIEAPEQILVLAVSPKE